ncbi:MAG: Asp-tRNA(Asn)/Glu-tRNA(Gln) amidotransferase GatCAB subunit A [Gammaproteobacteria bacterium]|nr:MAG: Asp-tRNA(Asn)/Glu-tRNA(Gln) amidotransferase GatCAB subunit A [Gammaproteobacteria bacterium]
MHTKSIKELHKLLTDKKISAVELAQHFIDRALKHNPSLNCYINILSDEAKQQAKIADDKIFKKEGSLLTGIPFALKDIFCTSDMLTTCGSKMLSDFIPPYDATAYKNLKSSDMVLLGKTNMDEFAMGSSNENSFFGCVQNPWDLDCVPGGSSGGSAVAVAGGLSPVAIGTDTGGSIRQPASFCGITGIKPTYGRVSRYGMIAFASSLDQGGVMAKSAEDCAYVLQSLSGYDKKDSTSMPEDVPSYTESLNNSIKGKKIGLPTEYFANLDDDLKQIITTQIKEFEKLGAIIVDISLPHTDLSVPAYYVISSAECSSNLARYDGVRYGYSAKNPKNLEDLYLKTRTEGFGDEVKRRILIGTYTLSAGYYDAYYIKAQKIRHLIADDFNQAFAQVDILLTPTTPTTAFKKGDKQNPLEMYLSDIYTVAVNLSGLPAISIPAGFHQKMPVGMQLISPAFCEHRLLNFAHMYQAQTDHHLQTPSQVPQEKIL